VMMSEQYSRLYSANTASLSDTDTN